MSTRYFRILLDTSFRAATLAAIVAFILLAVRVRSIWVRHVAWTIVLAAMLLMPVLPYFLPSIAISLPIPSAAVRPKTRLQKAMPLPDPALNSGVATASGRGMLRGSSTSYEPERKPPTDDPSYAPLSRPERVNDNETPLTRI